MADLAEAAPQQFLHAADRLADNPGAVGALCESGTLLGSHPHVHLLWALERLAWNKALLSEVTVVLGKLASRAPGIKIHNRPINSLREIHLPWRPQTMANAEERLAAIELLHDRFPDIGWSLVLALLPRSFDTASPTARPKWRPWAPETELTTAPPDYGEMLQRLETLVVRWAGESTSRWCELMNCYSALKTSSNLLGTQVLASLKALNPDRFEDSDRARISDCLREIAGRNREFPDAHWALPETDVCVIEDVCLRFQPREVFDRHKWLFTNWPQLSAGSNVDYQMRLDQLFRERIEAVRAIHEERGLAGLMQFADLVERPFEIGEALARLDLDSSAEIECLAKWLCVERGTGRLPHVLVAGIGYVDARFRQSGWPWVDALMESIGPRLGASGVANFALALPTATATWDHLDRWGRDASVLYWERTPIHHVRNLKELDRVVRQLTSVGRFYRALDVLGLSLPTEAAKEQRPSNELAVPPELIIDVLKRAAERDPGKEYFAPDWGITAHAVETLLDVLEKAGVEMSELARLEWIWLPALKRGQRGTKALSAMLSNDPVIFIDILKLVFRGDDDERALVSEQDRVRAEQAYDLLEHWELVPGTMELEPTAAQFPGDVPFAKGRIDEAKMSEWVKRARQMADDSKRIRICDHRLGQILAFAPQDGDATWPCAPVRNLIEGLRNEELEDGFVIGVFNRRGVHWRQGGGAQDYRLADKFREWRGRSSRSFLALPGF